MMATWNWNVWRLEPNIPDAGNIRKGFGDWNVGDNGLETKQEIEAVRLQVLQPNKLPRENELLDFWSWLKCHSGCQLFFC